MGITAERRGDRRVFSVAEDGIGIEPEYVDQILEVFNRLHSNDECQGTGIGLALCREIVDTAVATSGSTPNPGTERRSTLLPKDQVVAS